MADDNHNKFLEFYRQIFHKLRPRFSFHYVAYTTMFSIVIFSVVQIVQATTPNPGHPWTEVGDGMFIVTGQTVPRTYTYPDANATVLTTNDTVTIAQGGTGQITANDAINALLPDQTGNAGKYLLSDGTNTSWTTISAGVTSVFGRTGAVIATLGDYDTSLVPENLNLYFTDERAQDAIGTMISPEFIYTDTTPVLSINSVASTKITGTKTSAYISDFATAVQTTGDGVYVQLTGSYANPAWITSLAYSKLTGAPTNLSAFANDTGYITDLSSFTTGNLVEGSNLYYTATRFNDAFALKSTSNLTEGSNLYFTDTRVIAAPLTAYSAGVGTVSSSDTVLSAIQKIDANTSAKFTLPALTAGSILFSDGSTIAQDNSSFYWDDTNNRLAIGTNSFDGTNPEKLLVAAGVTSSVNLIKGTGSINSYLQLNVQNTSSGTAASSDVVATANNGSETTGYIDMGINSSGNTSGAWGSANDAYLYNMGAGSGGDLLVGTGTSGKSLIFMTGGSSTSNERMRIDGSGNVGIGTTPSYKLDVNGSFHTAASALINVTANGSGTTGTLFSVASTGTLAQTIFTISQTNGQATSTFNNYLQIRSNKIDLNGSVPLVWVSTNQVTYQAGEIDALALNIRTGSTLSTTTLYAGSTGNVGIGTTSFDGTNPEKLLVNAGTTTSVNAIKGTGSINSYLQLNIQNTSSGTSASSDVVATADNGSETTNYIDMGINGSGYTGGVFGSANDAYLYNVGQNLLIGTATSGKVIAFMTGGTSQSTNERMRIDGSGNVGIGTTSPAGKLDIADTAGGQLNAYQYGNNTTASSLNFKKARGTEASKTTVANADYLSGFAAYGYDGTTYVRGSYISSYVSGAVGTNNLPTDLIFATNAGASDATERMRILANGNVGIGSTNPGRPLVVSNNQNAGTYTEISNTTSGTGASAGLLLTGSASAGQLVKYSATTTTYKTIAANDLTLYNATAGNISILNDYASGNINFAAGGVSTPQMILTSGGVLGVGDTTPATNAKILSLVAGTLSGTTPGFKYTATMPSSPGGTIYGYYEAITGNGSASNTNVAHRIDYQAGYTGSAASNAFTAVNLNAGTGTAIIGSAGAYPASNSGFVGSAIVTTVGTNLGGIAESGGGNINVGFVGKAISTKNSATNVGVLGVGLNGGTSPVQVGGFFGLTSSDPTLTSAALIADNGSQTSDIFLARDNGSTVFSIIDGGNVGVGTGSPSARVHSLSTTEQLRLGYDTSNYTSFTVGSTGNIAIVPTGTAASVSISSTRTATGGGQALQGFGGTMTGSGTTSQFVYGTSISPTLVAGANNQVLSALNIAPTFTNGAFTGVANAGISMLESGSFLNRIGWHSGGVAQLGWMGMALSSGEWSLRGVNNNMTYFSFYPNGSHAMTLSSTQLMGVGVVEGSISAKIHAVRTSEQLRLGYDLSNYLSFTTGSTGVSTIAATGTAKQIAFNLGTIVDSVPGLSVTGTFPTTAAVNNFGMNMTLTTAGSSSVNSYAQYVKMSPGYTGSGTTLAAFYDNQVAGTGNTLSFAISGGLPSGNGGFSSRSLATTTGLNFGMSGEADGGNLNIGSLGYATVNKNSATNIGVVGFGFNGGTSPVQIGGYFGLNSSTPTFASAALIADNGSTTSPIFLARDNGSTVFSITDGGNVGIGTTPASTTKLDIVTSYATTGFPLSVRNSGYFNAYFQGTDPNNQAAFYLDNDRGSFASYGGFMYGGSTTSLGTLFGLGRADRLFMFSGGASNLGMVVGTITAQPFIMGTNNVERARIDSSGSFGIGDASPSTNAKSLSVVAGALSSGVPATSLSLTMPTTMAAATYGELITVTGAGSSSQFSAASRILYNAGYTGSNANTAVSANNLSAGTGSDLLFNTALGGVSGNLSIMGFSYATTTGMNVGAFEEAANGNVNVGLIGRAIQAKNSATNIGVIGHGRNTGTSPIQVGGWFSLAGANPTFTSAALVADNGDQTSPIFLARDNGSTVFGIVDGGNVGVGTTTFDGTNPEKLLVAAGTTTSVNLIKGTGSINSYLQLNVQNQSTGTSASSDVVATADNGNETTNYIDMGINGSGYTGGVFGSANDAYLYNLGQNMLIGTGTAAKSLVFMTGGTDQTTNERMRIDGSGNVGIGTNGPLQRLDIVGGAADTTVVRIATTGGNACTFSTSTGLFSCASDARLKHDINPILDSDALSKLNALNPVTFRYNWQTSSDAPIPGFIAQEFEQIFPDMVKTDPVTGYKSLSYGTLIPYTVKAIQEMNLTLKGLPKFEEPSIAERLSEFLRGIAEQGVAIVDTIKTKKVETEQLCIGDSADQVCVTKDQLRQLLQNTVQQNSGSNNQNDTPSTGSSDDQNQSSEEGDESVSDSGTPSTQSDESSTDTSNEDPVVVQE